MTDLTELLAIHLRSVPRGKMKAWANAKGPIERDAAGEVIARHLAGKLNHRVELKAPSRSAPSTPGT